MKRISYIAAAVAAIICVVSCEPERFGRNKKDIRLTVTSEVSTKSADNSYSHSETEEITTDGLTLFLTTTVSDNLGNAFTASPATKGTVVTSENFETERANDFNVRITDAGTTSIYFESKADNTKDDRYWYMAKGEEYAHWPEDDKAKLDFWAWSGAYDCSGITIKDSKTLQFSYNGTKTTAETQSDLLFANTPNQSNSSDGSVSIHFYHALAAVQFVVGNLDEGITVTGISIDNVKSKGTCSFVPAGASVDTKYVWTGQSTPVTYSQDFSKEKLNRKSDENFQHCFDGSEFKSTFFVVPQSLAESENITLTINVTDSEGRKYHLTHSIQGSAAISDWKAGKIYRYMISNGQGDVDVSVREDSFDGVTKKGVKAENTSSLPSYIRAVVLANWYNDGGKVVRPYTGSISYNTDRWDYQGGFYYYKSSLPGGETTDNLISEFVLNDDAPADTGFELHLEMQVFFQAVECKKNTTYGPSNFTK